MTADRVASNLLASQDESVEETPQRPPSPEHTRPGFSPGEVRAAAGVLVGGLVLGLVASVFLLHPLRLLLDGVMPPAPWTSDVAEMAVPQVIRDIFGGGAGEREEAERWGVSGGSPDGDDASDANGTTPAAGGDTSDANGTTPAAGGDTASASNTARASGATGDAAPSSTDGNGGVAGDLGDGSASQPGAPAPSAVPPGETAAPGVPTAPPTSTAAPIPSVAPPPPTDPAPTPVDPTSPPVVPSEPPPSTPPPTPPATPEPPDPGPPDPECSDGIDNDGDGLIDTGILGLLADPECADAADRSESR